MANNETIPEREEAMVVMGEAAAEKLHQFIHEDDQTDVQTESGPVPSLAKQAKSVQDYLIGLGSFNPADSGGVVRSYQNKLLDIVTGNDYMTPQLAANAGLWGIFFVPDGADITVEVPSQIGSLAEAIDAIDQWVIPTTSTVTINIAEGHHFTNKASVISHPYAERLIINGPEMTVSCKITGFIGATGVRGNYIATLSATDTSDISVGSWLSIREVEGNSGPYKIFNGCYQVTAVSVGSISVRIRLWAQSFPALIITTGDAYRFKAVIQALWCDGLIIKSSSPTVNYLLFAGNMWDYWSELNIMGTEKGTHGVYVGSNTIINGAGLPGGENPYGISGGSLSGKHVGAVDFDQQGFTAAGSSSIFGHYFVTSSCGRRGFYVGTSSGMEVKFSVSSTQYRDAVIADYGGTFNTSYFEGSGCRGAGAFSNNGGKIVAPNSHFWANGGSNIDIRAGGFGGFDGGSSRYGGVNGVHYEYGASGSIIGMDVSDSTIDGLSGIYSSAVRTTGAVIKNSGRYGVNSFCSAINISGVTLLNNLGGNIRADGPSSVFDGDKFEPITKHPAFFELQLTEATKTHYVNLAMNSIGDLRILFDGIAKLAIKQDGVLHPVVDGGATVGRIDNRFSAAFAREYYVGTGSVRDLAGVGSPEGSRTAVVGSTYRRENGVPGACFYVKESGVGNTGWVAK